MKKRSYIILFVLSIIALLVWFSCNPFQNEGRSSSKIMDLEGSDIIRATAAIYVSPSGNDLNDGSITSPIYSLSLAAEWASSGTTIYMRGGTFNYTKTVNLLQSGTSSAKINIIAYNNEKPVLNFNGMTYSDATVRNTLRGIFLSGNYWYIKGLEICYAKDNGIKVEGSHNEFELCVFHHNMDSGLQIGLGKNDVNSDPENITAYNRVINCDSYENYDVETSGGNADGFACKLHPGNGNYFYGCRAWNNSDDGWDFYHTENQSIIEYCWTWHNGAQANGNGQGFKLGDGTAPHIIRNSVAFDHKYTGDNNKGIDQNSNEGPVTVINCTSFDNEINYYFGSGHANNVLKNNVGFAATIKNISIVDESTQENNSWNLAVTADASDFTSIAVDMAKAPRQADGSLPTGFVRLISGSDLIDKGVNAGLPYNGSAPDLGAYEY